MHGRASSTCAVVENLSDACMALEQARRSPTLVPHSISAAALGCTIEFLGSYGVQEWL